MYRHCGHGAWTIENDYERNNIGYPSLTTGMMECWNNGFRNDVGPDVDGHFVLKINKQMGLIL
jgi:hypothetical protein